MADEGTVELFDALTHVLAHTGDPHVLMLAARSLARHDDAEGRAVLGTFLRNRAFLGRLDEATDPSSATRRLTKVFDALGQRADDSVRALCLALTNDPAFVSIEDRHLVLLRTLAEVRPMDNATVAYFEAKSAQDYAPMTAPLLLHNGSRKALDLFETMIADPEFDPEDHVSTLHTGVLPARHRLEIVQLCERLLDADLPGAVKVGVVESLYDHRSRAWFGPAIGPPTPKPWAEASTEALRALVALAPKSRTIAIPAKVDETCKELERILASR